VPSTTFVAAQEVVGVMQLINKAFGAFDEQDEDILGKTNPIAAHSPEASAYPAAPKTIRLSTDLSGMLCAETFLTIAGRHVKASSVSAASLPA
jgi:hypothetical protein